MECFQLLVFFSEYEISGRKKFVGACHRENNARESEAHGNVVIFTLAHCRKGFVLSGERRKSENERRDFGGRELQRFAWMRKSDSGVFASRGDLNN